MEVILDELTPVEFFTHGGCVKIKITNKNFMSKFNLKNKYVFLDSKDYIRFFTNLYISYIHENESKNTYDAYRYVNSCINLHANIGKRKYVVDLEYDNTLSFENARFYFVNDNTTENQQDSYGIKNVCFSTINQNNAQWDCYKKQRLERGFDDSELWNLDATIAKFITPRLIAFYENVHETKTHPSEMTIMDWENTLSKMIIGFKLLSLDREKTKEEEKQQWEAIKLFSKHFFNLWI